MAELWNTIILEPVLNSLIAMCTVLGGNFGLAIIVLTVIVRLILFPLTVRQTQSTKAMQSLQPRIQELQKKYAKSKEKLQQETMKLYKEAGINPLGCLWPMLIQLPIWIALYQSIMQALAATPENLLNLSQHLYSWAAVGQAVPLNEHFLWLRLSRPDPNLILAILVGGTMWVQQKMVTPPSADPRQKSMTSMTTMMMPLMFGFFTLSFPSGLALYWTVSNILGIIIQYFVSGGWGYLRTPSVPKQAPSQKTSLAQKPIPAEQQSKVLKRAAEQSKTIKQASSEEKKRRGLFGR
ncbi:MAG: membrane protein insertase YidC [Chloroflexi bacterium]|nr:membrane protein insertase YidC [Chloroflexota bacterium]MBL7061375.1 membrane protein insertase YidC [Dehalococcoidia bacterium]